MKFSHSLQFNAVPEWSSRYLSYSSLKKLIYALQKQSLLEKTSDDELQDEESRLLEAHKNKPIEVFQSALNKDLKKIDEFYKIKETQLYEDFQALATDVQDFQDEMKLKNNLFLTCNSEQEGEQRVLFGNGNATTSNNNTGVNIDNNHTSNNINIHNKYSDEVLTEDGIGSIPHSVINSNRPSFSRISSEYHARNDLLSQKAPEIYGNGNEDSDEDDEEEDEEQEISKLLKKKKSQQSMALKKTLSQQDPLKLSLINSLNLQDSFLVLSDIKITLKKRVILLYTSLCELKSFIELNQTGFKKILKKFDKTLQVQLKDYYLNNILINDSYIFKPSTLKTLSEKIETVIKFYAQVATNGSLTIAESELKLHLREHVVWERNTVWRDMINIERQSQAANIFSGTAKVASTSKSADNQNMLTSLQFFRPNIIVILAISAFLLIFSPFEKPEQKNCFALLIGASMFWASEAIPLFVTSLSMPLFVILLKVLKYDDPKHDNFGEIMTAPDASKYIFSTMWSSVIMLLLGGFTLAAALSKYSITRILSTIILSKSGTNPNSILLTIMLISLFVSAVVSNVAAPVLCYSIIQPLLRTLPTNSNFARSLILGVAFASNLGGVSSPISSPQNIIAIELMNPQPSWIQWFTISIPICLISLLLIWLFLLLTFKITSNPTIASNDDSNEVVKILPIQASDEKFTGIQWFIIIVSIFTIGLWCFANNLSGIFGEIGVISLIPIVFFFGSGVLTSEDWNNFLWTIVALAMGGIALGKAVSSSGLLKTIAIVIQEKIIAGLGIYQICLIFGFICLVLSTFISHTVSALILLPLVKEIGETIPNGDGDYGRLLVMLNVVLCSIAMGLPTSGFPNVTAICMTDQVGRNYVNVKTFITTGVPSSVVSYLVVVTVGYLVMTIMKF